jgi:capsular exopolysaccharide synthesis family protein
MSRVFEALTKASEEKNRLVTSVPKIVPADSPDAAQERAEPIVAVSVPLNGYQNDFHSLPVNGSDKTRSWRERIEELVFGWDLARYQNYPIVSMEQDSAAAEQYKILREQIKRLRVEADIDTFSITSPVKRDGKTTVAVNLAAVLALDYEERVLLIDGDLRAPSVYRYFNTPVSPGLGDYLSSSSRVSVKGLVRDTFLPGLRILPAGKPTHLSSELLAKEKMKQLMEEARAEFPGYQIIIDSPPILSTPDPLVISRHVGGVLVVVRAGKTPRDYLTKALQSLNSTKIMGIVLNGAELGISSKYYYYTAEGSY